MRSEQEPVEVRPAPMIAPIANGRCAQLEVSADGLEKVFAILEPRGDSSESAGDGLFGCSAGGHDEASGIPNTADPVEIEEQHFRTGVLRPRRPKAGRVRSPGQATLRECQLRGQPVFVGGARPTPMLRPSLSRKRSLQLSDAFFKTANMFSNFKRICGRERSEFVQEVISVHIDVLSSQKAIFGPRKVSD